MSFCEAEDIMYDQGIITREFNFETRTSYLLISVERLRVAATLFTKTLIPAVLKIYYIYSKNQQVVVNKLRHRFFPAVLAFLANNLSKSLASVQNDLTDDDVTNPVEQSVDCQVLYSPDGEITADVVFIHGLHGGVDRTWKQGQWRRKGHRLHSNSTVMTSYSDCWPQDWLPHDCPDVRVIALNYTTDVLWCPVWKKKRKRTGMVERSDEMIEELLKLGVGDKPIIWVGHSKGGLFIKQIIMNAWERHQDHSKKIKIFNNSKGVMFYSVPHKGSVLADITLPLLRRSVELIEIQRNCDFVLDLHKRFLDLCTKGHFSADICSFIETSFTLMSFVYLKIVAYESADPDVGTKHDVPLDHREICKPAGRDCFLYMELVKLIKKYM